ncbi:MAG TPA: HAD family hydrolase [Candidatus Dormibacteraeota bacterium]|nr:HAD family hydrolase [Candidatus Dormibacteraeota bacterium]
MTRIAFLLDVDNTLLDNDKVKADLEAAIARYAGRDYAPTFWAEYETVRDELDYVDVPLTLARFRVACPRVERFAELAAAVLFYPYEHCLYAGVPEVLAHLGEIGTLAIVSDGDPVFQPAKIARAGLAAAVGDRVLVYVHKEERLDDVQRQVPADLYVLVDDKPRVLAAVKAAMGDRVVTVHVRQGKYAREAEEVHADVDVGSIREVAGLSREDFETAVAPAPTR